MSKIKKYTPEQFKFVKAVKKAKKKAVKKNKVSQVEKSVKANNNEAGIGQSNAIVLTEPNRDVTQAELIEEQKLKLNFTTGNEWARQGIEWLSNSSINTPNFLWFMKYIILKDYKRKMERSSFMEWGKWLGDWGGQVAVGNVTIDEAWTFIEDDSKRFNPSSVNPSDGEQNEYYRTFGKKMLTEIVYQILYEKRDGETIQLERPIYYVIDGINVMWTGFIDIAYLDKDGKLVHWTELKTSYPKAGGFYKKDYKDKRSGEIKPEGSRIWRYPSIGNDIKPFHKSQMSIYAHSTNVLGDMLYCTADGSRFFSHDDYADLQWDSMKQAMSAVRDKALIRQNLLTLSADATTIIKVVPPEYDHYFFKNIEPEYKEMIFNIYKNNN